MKVSRKKTEYLCTNGETEWETIKIQEDEILRVTDFKYLGSTVQKMEEVTEILKRESRVVGIAGEKLLGCFVTRGYEKRSKERCTRQ